MQIELVQEDKKTFIVIKAEVPKKPAKSKSGKSILLATTNGNLNTGVKWNGSDIIAGVNVYVKAEA